MYTIYSTVSGRISRTVETDFDISIQLGSDENYLNGNYSGSSNYVNSEGQITAMPESPGEFYVFSYDTKQWEPDQSKAISSVQIKRQRLLYSSDWTQLPNGPLTAAQQAAWANYRQRLRDVTAQSGYPFNVLWPIPPQ